MGFRQPCVLQDSRFRVGALLYHRNLALLLPATNPEG